MLRKWKLRNKTNGWHTCKWNEGFVNDGKFTNMQKITGLSLTKRFNFFLFLLSPIIVTNGNWLFQDHNRASVISSYVITKSRDNWMIKIEYMLFYTHLPIWLSIRVNDTIALFFNFNTYQTHSFHSDVITNKCYQFQRIW